MKLTVCNKGMDDGMVCKFLHLKQEEYNFINSIKNWLPIVPEKADSINIDYYRDEFLGDFGLEVSFCLPENEILDTLKYTDWKLIDTSNPILKTSTELKNKRRYFFIKSQS